MNDIQEDLAIYINNDGTITEQSDIQGNNTVKNNEKGSLKVLIYNV